MQISDIRTAHVDIPGRFIHLVFVETSAGLVGIGESGLQRRPHAVDGAVRHLSKWLIGQNPDNIEHLWQRMFRGGFYPARDASLAAISAIDIALWDLRAKSLGVPLYQILGGATRSSVECFYRPTDAPGITLPNATEISAELARGSAEAASAAALALQNAGHRFIRLAPYIDDVFDASHAARRLVAQVRAIRDVAPDIEIMLDLHGRFSLPEARRLLTRLAPFDLFCVEDPLRSESVSAYNALAPAAPGVPLAVGEQWQGKWDYKPYIFSPIADFLRPDVCLTGGITEVRKIAAASEMAGKQLLLHNPLGPICSAASLQLCFALDNAGPQEINFRFTHMPRDLFDIEFKEDGPFFSSLPTRPGIGVSVDESRLGAHWGESTEPPHPVRRDGSFTNY